MDTLHERECYSRTDALETFALALREHERVELISIAKSVPCNV